MHDFSLTCRHLRALASLGACSLVSASASAGELHLLGLVPFAYAVDVSADGRVVTGYDPANCWYWTLETGVVFIPGALPPGNGVGGSVLITGSGERAMCSTLQGDPGKTEPTFFQISTQELDPAVGSLGFNCDISRASPWDMSPDGRFVAGLVYSGPCSAIGYVWDANTDVITTLPTLYFFKPTRANAVSDNGALAAGWNDDYNGYRQGCAWRRNSSGAFVGTLLDGGSATVKMREASACSGNGQWVYGSGRSSWNGGAPYRWSASATNGTCEPIAPAPTGEGSVQAANHDGSMLLTNFQSGIHMWIAGRGYVPIATWAQEHGVSLPEEWFLRGFEMTDDGLTIVGHAIRSADGGQSPFVLDLRSGAPACVPDLNSDGMVDGLDLTALLAGWGPCGSACNADFNSDSVVDGLDLTVILSGWGDCP
jgi:hypothetical protein